MTHTPINKYISDVLKWKSKLNYERTGTTRKINVKVGSKRSFWVTTGKFATCFHPHCNPNNAITSALATLPLVITRWVSVSGSLSLWTGSFNSSEPVRLLNMRFHQLSSTCWHPTLYSSFHIFTCIYLLKLRPHAISDLIHICLTSASEYLVRFLPYWWI